MSLKVSIASIKSTPSTVLDETAYDVIAALVEDGYPQRAAEACVRSTYTPGDNFADAYRKALTAAAKLRSSGRLRIDLDSISSNGVAGRAGVAAVSPAESTATRGAIAGSGAPVTKKSCGTGTPACAPQKPEKHVPSEKICGKPGCGKTLNANNQSGFCAQHFYESIRKSPAGKDAAPVHGRRAGSAHKATTATAVKRHRLSAGRPPSPPSPSSPLNGHALSPALREENRAEISELELDTLWARMPLIQKICLIFGRKEPGRKEPL